VEKVDLLDEFTHPKTGGISGLGGVNMKNPWAWHLGTLDIISIPILKFDPANPNCFTVGKNCPTTNARVDLVLGGML
jgi:hypothetical protein